MLRKILGLMSLFLITDYIEAKNHDLDNRMATYFKEIKAATVKGKSLWGIELYGPILLVNPDTRQVFSNYPDSEGILKANGNVFSGVLPEELNIANTSISWNSREWAMIMLPLSENKNVRINLLAHELFHRAQAKLGFSLHNPSNNHLNEKDGRILLRLELEALKKAVLAQTPSERKSHVTNAFIFRKFRHSVYSGATVSENLLEINEGLAEYTGVMISQRNKIQMQQHFISSINSFFDNPSFVRSFAYVTIPVYGYLLIDSSKDWNKNVKDNTNLTDYLLSAYEIHLPINLEKMVSEIRGQYNDSTIYQEETLRAEQAKKIKAGYMDKFVRNPHLEIHFENMNISFDPRNIVPLENYGTVYPNVRVTDNWGILTVESGALLSSSWDKITISLPTEQFKDKASGKGWRLELNDGYFIEKDTTGKNYILTKK